MLRSADDLHRAPRGASGPPCRSPYSSTWISIWHSPYGAPEHHVEIHVELHTDVHLEFQLDTNRKLHRDLKQNSIWGSMWSSIRSSIRSGTRKDLHWEFHMDLIVELHGNKIWSSTRSSRGNWREGHHMIVLVPTSIQCRRYPVIVTLSVTSIFRSSRSVLCIYKWALSVMRICKHMHIDLTL